MSDVTTDPPAVHAEVRRMGNRRTNAELVVDLVALGHLRREAVTVDPTYGLGRWWTYWRPDILHRYDLDPERAPDGAHDFRNLPNDTGSVDVVTLDGPYKLNGTSTGTGPSAMDAAYGVAAARTWQDRHRLICDGITEAARVLHTSGTLIVKCQDQVSSGQMRWQSHIFTAHAELLGFRLVDVLHVGGYRRQPPGRGQVHARSDYSSALVLRRDGADTEGTTR